MSQGKIFLLDNIDSFTYNLVDELAQLGFELEVYRNTVNATVIFHAMQQAAANQPVMLCLSPGPGHPRDAGCLLELIALCQGKFPMLGICLGFQALIHASGGHVDKAAAVMHGKSSAMQCQPHEIFQGLPNPLTVARYHSLQAVQVPASIELIAKVTDQDADIPMAFYHQSSASIGFQFHPESIMTVHGSNLLSNTVSYLLTQAAQLTTALQPAHGEPQA